jgi:tRNA 2-selenouridine synthase
VSDLQYASLTIEEVIEGGLQVVDVRSPGEYADGLMPGALNLPFLDDEQRAVVGTAYKQEGAAQARLAAMDEVAPCLSEYLHRLVDLGAHLPRGRRMAVMCWRGGERSRNVVLLLALVGVHAVAVQGGYKAYRRYVLAQMAEWISPVPVVTLYGHTGAGKSALLRGLAKIGPDTAGSKPWPVDLEELALHRGSLLGGLNQPGQRRQKDFDAMVWEALRRPQGDYLVMEGEGGKIGRIFLPQSVAETIRGGIAVLVSASVETRAERIMEEYAPENWTSADVAGFRRGLELIGARLPRDVLASLETAFDDGRFTDVVRGLLVSYYDPLYQRSCVDGRQFVWQIETTSDPVEDARRFVENMAGISKEVPSDFPL